MRVISLIKIRSRPLRRVVTPRAFKEYYINRVTRLHDSPTYLEIGVRWGESFRAVHAGRKIGIDPVRHPRMETLRADEEFFETTSDSFFEMDAFKVLQPHSVHVALIDGLHEFCQVSRDLLNLEPYMAPGGLIVVDDCNPQSETLASDRPTGGGWNGDVWKLIPFVARELPDLRVTTVDQDQGVGLIWGFTDTSTRRNVDDSKLAEYKVMPYSQLASDRASALRLTRGSPRRLRDLGVPI